MLDNIFGFGKKKGKQSKKPVKKESKREPKEEIDVGSEIKHENKKEGLNIRDKLDKGYIHARVIIEILGGPKEHIENTISEMVEVIKTQQDMHVIKSDFSETEQQGEFFSKFVEIEMLFKNPKIIIGFCFDYMPSSIEVIEPERPEFTSSDLSALFNDLQARLHQMDMLVKQFRTENTNLRTNAGALLRNLAIIILKQKPLKLEELSKQMGIPKEQLKPFIDTITQQGFLKEKEGLYSTADYNKAESAPKKEKVGKKLKKQGKK